MRAGISVKPAHRAPLDQAGRDKGGTRAGTTNYSEILAWADFSTAELLIKTT